MYTAKRIHKSCILFFLLQTVYLSNNLNVAIIIYDLTLAKQKRQELTCRFFRHYLLDVLKYFFLLEDVLRHFLVLRVYLETSLSKIWFLDFRKINTVINRLKELLNVSAIGLKTVPNCRYFRVKKVFKLIIIRRTFQSKSEFFLLKL